jgi:alpha-glucosidase
MSTHDSEGRGATRWCRGVPGAIRCALLVLLTLRGTPILYYGDEIGMTEPPSREMRRARRDKTQSRGSRDSSRTPMQWSVKPGAGFTTSPEAWLPIGDAMAANVEAQMADRQSILWLVHDLLALRRSFRDLAVGTLAFASSPAGTLTWRRGEVAFVAVNLGTTTRHVKTEGRIAICTDRARDGERVGEWLELPPLEAAVVRETGSGLKR